MINTVNDLLKYLIPYKKKLFLGLLFLFLGASLEIINPKILRRIIDGINTLDNPSSTITLNIIYFYAALLVGIMLIRGIFLYYTRLIIISISRRIEYDIRNLLYDQLLILEPNFYQKHKTGDLISRVTSDLEMVRMIFGPGIMYSLNVILLFAMSLISMLVIDVTLTLLALAPLVILIYLIKVIGERYYEQSKAVQEELGNLSTFVNENLQGIRIIKSYVKESFMFDLFQKLNYSFIQKNLELAKVSGLFRPLLVVIAGLSSIIILWVGGHRVYENKLTLGHLIEFLRYIEILSIPIMAMGWVISIFQRGKSAYQRIMAILQTDPAINDDAVSDELPEMEWSIDIRNLSFAYDEAVHLVLKNISLSIKKGEKIGLIGPTGSGKTTLVSLILRLYEPPPASIFIDNIPIQQIPLKDLRNGIGYVPQENFFFPDTITENIHFGSNGKNDFAQIKQVAQLAQFSEEIESFPNSYEELIGEQGVTLSGGQKQRLGIARALSHKPNIFIFDDSFSNIDSETEKKILMNLHQVFKEETVIIIAHRASTIRHVDKVIVLDQGQIKEFGKPDELIKTGGFYAQLLQHEKLSHDLQNIN